jgi:hypothetical protein
VADRSPIDVVTLSFVIIPIALAVTLATADAIASRRLGEAQAARRRALNVVLSATAWMSVTWFAAARGTFRDWDATRPPFALLVAGMIALSCIIGFGPQGRRLASGVPLWILVAIQSFRLPLELAMHAMYERGVVPQQMSYSGWNFDIATGITAIVVAAMMRAGRAPRWIVAAWNLFGFALLFNIVTIAIVSTPRVQAFGPDRINVWVMDPPFVWLPAVMVLAALAGHLVIFRALSHGASSQSRS